MTTDNTPIETSEREARPWLPSDGYLSAAGQDERAAIPMAPFGWRLVPVELTPEMRSAFHGVTDSESLAFGSAGSRWRAMLSAAPQPPAAQQGEAVEQSERAAWWSLVMNAASAIEDAENCLRDPDAKAAAHGAAKHYREAAQKLWAAAPAGVVGEPVAWSPDLTYPGYSQTRVWANGAPHQKDIDYWRKEGCGITLAYTAPPALQALTDEQMVECVRSIGLPVPMGLIRDRGPYEITEPSWFLTQLVRAIERAHGIGGKGGADHG